MGWYFYFWLWKFVQDFNKNCCLEPKKKLNFFLLAIFPFILDVADTFHTLLTLDSDEVFTSWDRAYIKVSAAVLFCISMAILKKIEEFAKERYGKVITHNGLGVFFFNFFYVNFALNTFSERVMKGSDIQLEDITPKETQ